MSISERDRPRIDRQDLLLGLAVSLTALVVFWLTIDASVAGLSPPDAPAEAVDDQRALEYLSRASGFMCWPIASALAGGFATGVTYSSARMLGATRALSVAAALAFAFGRGMWAQALLPGVEAWLTLLGALTIFCVLRSSRSHPTMWMGAAMVSLAASAGRPAFNPRIAGHALAVWVFLELNAACIAFALLGAATLFRERRRDAVMMATAAVVLLLLVPFRASSPHAALLPFVAAIWPAVAVGASRLAGWLRWRPGVPAIATVMTIVPLAGNYRHVTADHAPLSRWYLDRLAEQTRGCGFVLGQSRTVPVPDPERLGRVPDGCRVYALEGARGALEHAGYRFDPVLMPGPSLARYLRLVPGGSAIAFAVPAAYRGDLKEAPPFSGAEKGAGAYAVVGIAGSADETIENSGRTADARRDDHRNGQLPIRARSDDRVSSVEIGGLEIIRSEAASLVVVAPGGEVSARYELGPDLLVPFDRRVVGLARLAGRVPCVTLSESTWTNISTLASQGNIGVRLTGDPRGGIALYAARDRPLDPSIVSSWGQAGPRVESRAFRRSEPADLEALTSSTARDGLPSDALASFANVHRTEIAGGVAARGMLLTSLDFAGIPSVVFGHSLDAHAVTICPAPRDDLFADPATRRESIGGRRSSFGDGWGPPDHRHGVTTRSLARSEGELLVSLARVMPIDIVLSLLPAEPGRTIALRINGTAIDTKPFLTGSTFFRWTVPANLWKTGVNQVLVVSQPGIRIKEIELVQARR